MKSGQKLWTRNELILAVNLYCKLPFGRLHSRNPDVIELANLIGRSANSVAFKLVNFASLDPNLKARGIKGAYNVSNLDKDIWKEFFNNWDELFLESEKELAKRQHTTLTKLYQFELESSRVGEEKMRNIKVRVNQSIFRRLVLSNYDNRCCITGIDKTELLVAGHIVPWGQDKNNRLNPRNGLLLNALHDRAFEHGLITVDTDYKVRISPFLKKKESAKSIETNFLQFEGKSIILPKKFLPSSEFLKIHNLEKFKA